MSEAAHHVLALLVAGVFAVVYWRAAVPVEGTKKIPSPCFTPVAVEGEVPTPGVVCVAEGQGQVELLATAGASDCETARRPVAAGDLLIVTRSGRVCRVAHGRQPAAALRALRVAIDLNRASAAELRALPGIGARLAQRIVEHRAARGPFRQADDLAQVRGIGAATLARLRRRILAKLPPGVPER